MARSILDWCRRKFFFRGVSGVPGFRGSLGRFVVPRFVVSMRASSCMHIFI